MTTDLVSNIRAIGKLIPKNAQVAQAIRTHALRQALEVNEASLLQLLQPVRPSINQLVNIKA